MGQSAITVEIRFDCHERRWRHGLRSRSIRMTWRQWGGLTGTAFRFSIIRPQHPFQWRKDFRPRQPNFGRGSAALTPFERLSVMNATSAGKYLYDESRMLRIQRLIRWGCFPPSPGRPVSTAGPRTCWSTSAAFLGFRGSCEIAQLNCYNLLD